MDYRGIIEGQIKHLQALQLGTSARKEAGPESACKLAETILLLCKEIENLPKGKA